MTRTSQLSYLLLTSLSELFPPKLAITVTAGGQDLSAAQAEIILPAAIGLLPEFHGDFRHVIVSGKRKQVMLIDAFVNRTHPMWAFNNVLTLTLWALPHASNDDHSLKVGTMLRRLRCNALHDCVIAVHCTMLQFQVLHVRVLFEAVFCNTPIVLFLARERAIALILCRPVFSTPGNQQFSHSQ